MKFKLSLGTFIGAGICGAIGVLLAKKGAYSDMGEYSLYGVAIGAIAGTVLWSSIFKKKARTR